ncbi:MAG TPA: hypothetical protein PLD55_03805 [bacterium]|nr:hypothetical protein [bacterium]HQM83787.1 hypothetical protein [bacterium]
MKKALFFVLAISTIVIVSCGGEEDFDCSNGAKFAIKGDVVKNCSSGLWWTKKSVSGKTFDQAYNYCLNLKLDGVGRWRLPTLGDFEDGLTTSFQIGEDEYGDPEYGCIINFPNLAKVPFWTGTWWCEGCVYAYWADREDGMLQEFEEFCEDNESSFSSYDECAHTFYDECWDEFGEVIYSSIYSSWGSDSCNNYGFNYDYAFMVDVSEYCSDGEGDVGWYWSEKYLPGNIMCVRDN